MKSRTLSAAAMILLTPLVVLAFQAEAGQVRKGELKDKSFTACPLKSEPSARWRPMLYSDAGAPKVHARRPQVAF